MKLCSYRSIVRLRLCAASGLVACVFAAPGMAQQIYTVTPLEPSLAEVSHGAIGAAFYTYTQKPSAGSLAISVTTDNNSTASGTIAVAGPASLSGAATGTNLRFASPQTFTVNAALNGARLVRISAFTLAGLRQAEGASVPLTLDSIEFDQTQLIAYLGIQVAFRLPITPGSEFNSSEIRFDVRFRWKFTPVCAAPRLLSPRAADDPCEPDDLAIHHIQVVQTVQTPRNDAKLIIGKETWVRVFVKSVGDRARTLEENITGTLRVDGAVLKPDRSLNTTAFPEDKRGPLLWGVEYFPNFPSLWPATVRYSSLIFNLGEVKQPTLNLQAEVWIEGSDGLPKPDADASNNRSSLSASLEEDGASGPFIIGYGPVCVTQPSKALVCPVEPEPLE